MKFQNTTICTEVKLGYHVQPGTELDDIYWDDNSREPVVAPDGCYRTISWRNADLDYLNFRYWEQIVLKL